MILQLKLNNFNGPMDLLLDLVKEHKLDLFDLDIRELANQYNDFVNRQVQDYPLDELAEYLVMAAYLYDLKVKTLLPTDEESVTGNESDLERDRLVARLIEYQRYKAVLAQLQSLALSRQTMLDKTPSDPALYDPQGAEAPLPAQIDPRALAAVIKKVVARFEARQPVVHTVVVRELSAESIEAELLEFLRGLPDKTGTLTGFIEQVDQIRLSMQYFAVALVALLTLVRTEQVSVHQTRQYDEIVMSYKQQTVGGAQ